MEREGCKQDEEGRVYTGWRGKGVNRMEREGCNRMGKGVKREEGGLMKRVEDRVLKVPWPSSEYTLDKTQQDYRHRSTLMKATALRLKRQ